VSFFFSILRTSVGRLLRRAALLGACLALLTLGAGAAEVARTADGFVDSMGTNIHSAFGGAFITNPQGVADAFNDIGFRYARDIPTTPDRLNALTEAAPNLKLCIISQYLWFGTDAFDVKNFDAMWSQIKQVNNIGFLELPNEPQNFEDYNDKLHTWTAKLYQTAKADPQLGSVPLVSCTVYYPTPQLADLSPYLDYGNLHSYTDIVRAGTTVQNLLSNASSVTGNKPVIATETGFSNSYLDSGHYGISEAASAKYLPRLFLEHFNAGIVKTFNYEFIDSFPDDAYTNAEAHYGLLRTDLSYKPAAVAIKNLISLLKDPGADFAPRSLNYTLTSGASGPDIHHTLLQKRDGSFWLALWQNVASYDAANRQDLVVDPVNVALAFNGIPVVTATTYVPNVSVDPNGAVNAAQIVNVAVDDRVTLVRLLLAEAGDANADGRVDDSDVATFLRHYAEDVTAAGGWALGDFNRDGRVGFADFQMMELNYRHAFSDAEQAEMSALGIAVPEPRRAFLLLSMVGCAICGRRQRARNRIGGM
jgi:hypothetical protein